MPAKPADDIFIHADKVVKLLDAFKADNKDDWLQQLHWQDTVVGEYEWEDQKFPVTVGQLTDAIRDKRFLDWQKLVPAYDRDWPHIPFSEFVRLHYKVSLPKWAPDPNYKVVFSSSPKGEHRNYEGKPRSHFKDVSRTKNTPRDMDDSFDADENLDASPDDDIEIPPVKKAAAPVKAPVKKAQPAAVKTGSAPTTDLRPRLVRPEKATAPAKLPARTPQKLITLDQIIDSARKTLAAGNRGLNGVIMHGELADGETTWGMIATYVKEKKNGLTAKNCPHKTLWDIVVKRVQNVTLADIAESVLQTILQSKKTPTSKSEKILYGRLAGRGLSWRQVNRFIREKTNGLTASNCPYANLEDLIEGEGLDLNLNSVIESIKATYKAQGIHELKGVIMEGPLANGKRTWGSVRIAIRDKTNGLTDANCPFANISEIIDRKILVLKIQDIIQAARLTLKEEGRLNLRGEKIMYGRLGDEGFWTWDMVRAAVEQKTHGMTAENCPAKTLPQLLEAYGVKHRQANFRQAASPDKVREQSDAAVKSYQEQFKAAAGQAALNYTLPPPEHEDLGDPAIMTLEKIVWSMRATQRHELLELKGLIKYGPLANGERTWEMADAAVQNKTDGFDAENCPYNTLQQIEDERLPLITVDEICISAASTYKLDKTRNLIGVIQYGPLADGERTWDDVRRSVNRKSNGLNYTNCRHRNLSALLEANNVLKPPLFTRTEAIVTLLNTRAATGEWPAEKDSIDYPPLKGRVKMWKTVENSMRLEQNGITKAELPFNTWRELMIDEGLMKPLHLDVRLIGASAFATWLASIDDENPEGRWPTRKDGLVLHGPLADGETKWTDIEDAIRMKRFGLTDGNCPYSKSVHELLVGEGFVVDPFELTVEMIRDSANATYDKTGFWPTAENEIILYGPLAGMDKWSRVSDAIVNHHRGLTKDVCPYNSLSEFLKAECGKHGRFDKVPEAAIA